MDINEEIPYELTTENIKIPYFNNPDFEKLLMKPINQEIFIDDLSTLYIKQEELLSLYSNLIKSNRNGINENCLTYKKNTYDYILLMKSIKLLSSVIRNKISPLIKEDEDINLETIFDDREYNNIIKEQYKNKEKKNYIIKIISVIIEHSKNIKQSNHKCGIIFMDICVKYLILFIDIIKNQIEKFSEIKNFNMLKQDEEIKLKNHIILLELIKNLEKLDTVDLVLNNGFYIDENDINNIPEESKEYKKMKKKYFRVISKNEKEIVETYHKLMNNNEKMKVVLYN